MKNKILFFLLFSICWNFAFSMDIGVVHHTFKGVEKNYVEVNLFIVGSTVTFMPADDNQLKAGVEVLILIKQDSSIVQYEKYNLWSPLSGKPLNFVDMKRFAIDNGDYNLEVIVTDLNQAENTEKKFLTFKMDYDTQNLQISDIQLLGSCEADPSENVFVKNGYRMESLPFNFYNRKANKFMFYAEIYNSGQAIGEQFLVRYTIERLNGKGVKKPVIRVGKKRMPKEVNTLLMQKNISELPSGNYNLLLEVCNQKSEVLLTKSTAFQRSNPTVIDDAIADLGNKEAFVDKLTKEELRYSLKAIAPIIESEGVHILNEVIALKDTAAQRATLYGFWLRQNEQLPDEAYRQYMVVAKAVDEKFKSGFGHGFESDRGFTFMKYGKPDNIISVMDEPTAPPYEIWSYNDFPKTKQTNVKFLFYNPSLAAGNFRLLHSTARGELQNQQWEVELYRDDPGSMNTTDFDSTMMPDGIARRARQYFNDF